jgi:hypothetical protein
MRLTGQWRYSDDTIIRNIIGCDCVKSFGALDDPRCNIANIYVKRLVVTAVTIHCY